jgi:hypothetical protein
MTVSCVDTIWIDLLCCIFAGWNYVWTHFPCIADQRSHPIKTEQKTKQSRRQSRAGDSLYHGSLEFVAVSRPSWAHTAEVRWNQIVPVICSVRGFFCYRHRQYYFPTREHAISPGSPDSLTNYLIGYFYVRSGMQSLIWFSFPSAQHPWINIISSSSF